MTKRQFTLGFRMFLLASVCIAAVSQGQTADTPDPVQEFGRARDVDDLKRVYRSLFRQATPDRISQLKQHSHQGLALQAAWEPIRRSALKTMPHDGGLRRIDRRVLQRFLGFVEGRLRLKLPVWWENLVGNAYYDHDGVLAVAYPFMVRMAKTGVPATKHRDCPYCWSDPGLLVPMGTDLASSHRGLRVSIGDRECEIPTSLLEKAKEDYGDYDALNVIFVDDHRCIVAFHTDIPGSYPVYCVECSSGKSLWETEVWDEVVPGGLTGEGYFHWVQLEIDQGILYVFGATNFAVYLEGFSTRDGTNLFRFSTSY